MNATFEYTAAINTLRDFSEKEAGLGVEIQSSEYPVRFVFKPESPEQMSLLEDNVIEKKTGELIITCGLSSKVENTLDFLMDATILKKLIRIAEKTSYLYYHSFCERALSDNKNEKQKGD